MYEIPQQLEYQEKIVFNLTFVQLIYAIIFAPIIFTILRSSMNLAIKMVLSISLAILACAFMFLNLAKKIQHFSQWYLTRKLDQEGLKRLLGNYQVKDDLIKK